MAWPTTAAWDARGMEDSACSRPTLVDLFCGAGGLSLGFQRAGFRIIRAIDNSPAAVQTYNSNVGAHAVLGDITENVDIPECLVIVGGPPCQGFSSAGQRRPGDRRNTLVATFAQIVAEHRPVAFVFENVEGFLTAEGGHRVLDLLLPVVAAGYRVHIRKVNAANYGVPQHRKRVIAVGGLGWDPMFPVPTHRAYGAPGAARIAAGMPPAPTLGQAIGGLPPPAGSEPGVPRDHYYRPLNGGDSERARHLLPGQTMRDLPDELRHRSYARRAYRRVMDGTPTERRGGAPAGLRRLRHDHPSKAITSGASREFLHPFEDRPLTLRECARIQGFPDTFTFDGSARDRAVLIGDAVPPPLAYAIAVQLLQDLATASPGRAPGQVLSFVPTVSQGMSPSLERTCQLVDSALGLALRRGGQLPLWD